VENSYGNLARASSLLGKHKSFLYSQDHVASLRTLFETCDKLGLDFAYILTGKKTKPKTNISLDNLVACYKNRHIQQRIPNNIKSIISMLKKGKNKNIRLATLLYLSELLSISPLDLI
jgi:hypothetical protein